MREPVSVGWFDDGRAGHRRQVQALVYALSERLPIREERLEPWGTGTQIKAWLRAGRRRPGNRRLVIGAGHDTHFSLLAARRSAGARSVVLMQPSLPLGCFDLCVIPEHDRPPDRDNVLETDGPLTPLRPSDSRTDSGLILIGGPSRHFAWDTAFIWAQLGDLILTQPERAWVLTTSRRTPAEFLARMPETVRAHLAVHPFDELPAGWLDRQLPHAGCCVATPDSVSMVYDALACGIPCALLQLKGRENSRIAAAMRALLAQQRVRGAGAWIAGTPLPVTAPVREAERVAAEIRRRWFR